MPGVTIVSFKTKKSLGQTNTKGEFTVKIGDNENLLFKFIGFVNKTVIIKPTDKNITVVLKEDQNGLDEVVVRGYVSRSKELSTGSSFTISGAEVQDVPVANIEQLLQGKVPGMNIQINTGAPGFRGTTQIRGLSTLSVSGSGNESFLQPTSPLYVIDGVPLDANSAEEMGYQQQGPGVSPLSMIPQEDVESIEILKDAQATSLYGSMAAYGVIIIKTKRGSSEIPRIRYTGNYFVKTPPKLRSTLGGNLERAFKINEILQNATSISDIDKISQTPFLSDSLNAYYNNSTDWQGLYYGSTFNQSHNLAIDGGDQTFSYKTNLGYYNEQGIIQNTGFERYTGNIRMDYQPNNSNLKFMGQFTGQIGKQNKGSGTGLLQTGVASSGQSSTLLPDPSFYTSSNEYLSALSTDDDNLVKSLRANIEASYMILKGLSANAAVSYHFQSKTESTFVPAEANNMITKNYAYNGTETELYSRNSLTYSLSLHDKHNFFFNAFNEIRIVNSQNASITQVGTANDQIKGPIGFDAIKSEGGIVDYNDQRAISFALAASYDYKKKYVLDLSYRLDGSSGNGFDDLYTKNPAVGLRWNFSKENFSSELDWLNMGAIRLSWGINVIPNSTLQRIYGKYNITGNYNGEQGIGIDYGTIPNPVLKPTTTSQFNLGLDLNLFHNKIDLIYDTYYKKVDNLLFDMSLPNTVGFSTLNSNDAAISNYGHELSITFRPLPATSKVDFMFTINGAYNKDVLTKLPAEYGGQYIRFDTGDTKQHNLYRVGSATLSNYLLINEGVYATDSDVPVNPKTGLRYQTNGTFFQAGDPIFKDMNGDYILDEKDYTRTGNNQPLFTGGMSTTIGYASFTLSINASYTWKRTILNNALADRLSLMKDPFSSTAVVPLTDINMWRKPGDIAKYPYAYNYTRFSTISPFRYDQTLWAEDGSYLKINNIILAYQFNKRLVRTWGLNNLRVYLSMDNLITFSPYSGPNPENVTSMGRDVSNGYPVPRSYNIGINIEF